MVPQTRLVRSDSSTSSWLSHQNEQCELPPQRRIRHVQEILIRNLSLNPRRDALSSLLNPSTVAATPSSRPRIQFAADDTDLYLRTRRLRAGSNASSLGTSAGLAGDELLGGHSSGFGAGGDMELSGPSHVGLQSKELRRGGSAGAHGIREEVEPPSPRAEVDDPITQQQHMTPSAVCSPPLSSSIASLLSASAFPNMRKRSTSRASLISVTTTASSSTVRPSSHMPHKVEPYTLAPVNVDVSREVGRMSYSSELQLAKEKQRRIETLRKRLVDSFISLSVVPLEASTREGPRKRGTSGSSIGSRGKLARSGSSSSTIPRGRNRTHSTPPGPPGGVSPSPTPEGLSQTTPSIPFFVSEPQRGTTHPAFEIDERDFLMEDPEEWTGSREGRVVVSVWTRSGPELCDEKLNGKGKNKETDQEWTLLLEWDVELDGLVSLGCDPILFPALPPNTIIFQIHEEYFTAPLPSFAQQNRAMYNSESDSSDSENGNVSDPGTVALVGRRRKREMEEEEQRRRRSIVAKSVRETRMVPAASLDRIIRLRSLENEVRETRAAISETKKQLDSVFDPGGVISLARERDELKDKVEDLTAYQAEMVLDLDDYRADLNARRRALRARSDRVVAAREMLEVGRKEVRETMGELRKDEISFAATRQRSNSRRTQLITLLSQIFPIEAAEDPDSTLLFTIVGTPLPNSSYPSSFSDETLSSALGFAAQVMSMLSAYLGVPLHYPIQCLGSRSAVLDLISVMRGPRAFPLYGRGVDKYRFDYGVFLLNKNIEQLMYSQGLTVPDLRNTLPNLHALILSLSYDPSQSEFTSSTLAVAPRFDPIPDSPSLQHVFDTIAEASSSSHLTPPKVSSTPFSENGRSTAASTLGEVESEIIARSPSTVRAPSVRSVSPTSTLRGVNGTHEHEAGELPEEKPPSGNGATGMLSGHQSILGVNKGKGLADFLKSTLARGATSNVEGVASV